jgi:hypothetical protein
MVYVFTNVTKYMYKKTVMSITFVTIFAITILAWQWLRAGATSLTKWQNAKSATTPPKKICHAVTKVIDIPLWVI